MLEPIQVKHSNMNLRAPIDWDDSNGTCMDLPVHHDKMNNTFYSYWQLTDEDRQAIADGAVVRLGLMGQGHPPVSVDITHADEVV